MHGALASSGIDPMPNADTAERDLLRFIVCGSVDDGKSTLIGRLLHETGSIPADQLETLAAESRRFGTQGSALDLSLLVDELSAEREQGITIDVAYRYFSTARRKFIVIDAPGHEQYTRNMVTGASQADFGILIVDAQQGLTDQTRRHARLLKLLGVTRMVLAVNKMDRVRYLQEVFEEVAGDFARFAHDAGLGDFTSVPIAALTGANVVERSAAMAWYKEPSLFEVLETTLPLASRLDAEAPFRMPVQLALRPSADFRGFAGTISSGRIAVGDEVCVQPSGRITTVDRIVTYDGDLRAAGKGQAVVLVLGDAVDCARGDLFALASAALPHACRISADLVWLSEDAFDARHDYQLKIATRSVGVKMSFPEVDRSPSLNDIVSVELVLSSELAAARYADEPTLGSFILIDRETQATVAAGMIGELHQTCEDPQVSRPEDIVWLDQATGRVDALVRVMEALAAGGNRLLLIDDDLLAAELCSDLDSVGAEWSRRALAVARVAARSGATVIVATRSLVPDDPGINVVRDAAQLAPDWVI